MQRLRDLHEHRPLVLVNAWDAASATVIAAAGAPAIATTSGGVAWANGVPDAGGLDRDLAIDAIARIVAAVDIPVSADLEGGYADHPEGVAETVALAVRAGVAGINLEDSPGVQGQPLRTPDAQARRLAAARLAAVESGVDIWINARTDTYLAGGGDPADRLEATLERAHAYALAGADSLFVPGLTDLDSVAAIVAGPLPVNVMVSPGAPAIAEFADIGVARVSVGTAVAQAAYAVAAAATRELLSSGTYGSLQPALGYGELNELLRSSRTSARAGC